MTQRIVVAGLCLLLLSALQVAGCGKYGRPQRIQRPPPAQAAEVERADEEANAFDPDGPGGEPPESLVEEENP